MRRASLALFVGLAAASLAADSKPPSEPLQKALAAANSGDFAKAKKLLAAEAAKGNAEAANGLGELTLAGRDGKPDLAEAAKWFQKAADAGNAQAMFNLSQLLARGTDGVPANEEKARFFLNASAEAGYAPAQYRLALISEPDPKARIDKAQYAESQSWLERAAAQDYAEALLALVRYYDDGLGSAPVDPRKATDFCMGAARAGSVVAMNEVATRYQKGLGIQKDNVAAIGWLTLAAQYDLPAAHVNLGFCYETGNGVRTDYDRAGQHYAAATRQNFAPAQFLLGRMIEDGKGTKANPVHAYVLYARAAAGKQAGAAERRDALKAKLKPAELAEAEQLLQAEAPPAPSAGGTTGAKAGIR